MWPRSIDLRADQIAIENPTTARDLHLTLAGIAQLFGNGWAQRKLSAFGYFIDLDRNEPIAIYPEDGWQVYDTNITTIWLVKPDTDEMLRVKIVPTAPRYFFLVFDGTNVWTPTRQARRAASTPALED